MSEVREHIHIDYENCEGFTIEAIHHRDESILILFTNNKFAVMTAEGDEEWAYLATPHNLTASSLITSGFSLELITKERLVSEKELERYAEDAQKREERKLAEDRAEYERLKAKFEGANP